MSKILLTLPAGEVCCTGKQITFQAPCASEDATALTLDGKDYTICDASGKDVCGCSGLWVSGAIVSVILDCSENKAYIQNGAGGSSDYVVLTQAEYDALEEPDENTLYIISDEVDEITRMSMHMKNQYIHVTAAEKEKWNNVDFSSIEQKITALESKISGNIPKISYGTEDLVAGVTPLEEGEVYFVYE